MRICIKIEQLENLLEVAKNAKKSNSDLSNCIEITLLAENKNHAGSDKLRFENFY